MKIRCKEHHTAKNYPGRLDATELKHASRPSEPKNDPSHIVSGADATRSGTTSSRTVPGAVDTAAKTFSEQRTQSGDHRTETGIKQSSVAMGYGN